MFDGAGIDTGRHGFAGGVVLGRASERAGQVRHRLYAVKLPNGEAPFFDVFKPWPGQPAGQEGYGNGRALIVEEPQANIALEVPPENFGNRALLLYDPATGQPAATPVVYLGVDAANPDARRPVLLLELTIAVDLGIDEAVKFSSAATGGVISGELPQAVKDEIVDFGVAVFIMGASHIHPLRGGGWQDLDNGNYLAHSQYGTNHLDERALVETLTHGEETQVIIGQLAVLRSLDDLPPGWSLAVPENTDGRGVVYTDVTFTAGFDGMDADTYFITGGTMIADHQPADQPGDMNGGTMPDPDGGGGGGDNMTGAPARGYEPGGYEGYA